MIWLDECSVLAQYNLSSRLTSRLKRALRRPDALKNIKLGEPVLLVSLRVRGAPATKPQYPHADGFGSPESHFAVINMFPEQTRTFVVKDQGQRRKLLHLAANVIRVSNPKDDESPYKKLSAWAREAVKVQYPEGFIEIPAPDSANKAGHGWATRIYDLHFGPGGLEEEQFRAVLFWPMGPHNNDKQIHPVMGFHPKTDQELDDFWNAIESVRKHSNYPELLEGLNRCFVAWPLCVS